MDRRTQRALLVVLLFGVAILLYRSWEYRDSLSRNGDRRGRIPGEDNTALRLDPHGLAPANSTLGVGLRLAILLPCVLGV